MCGPGTLCNGGCERGRSGWPGIRVEVPLVIVAPKCPGRAEVALDKFGHLSGQCKQSRRTLILPTNFESHLMQRLVKFFLGLTAAALLLAPLHGAAQTKSKLAQILERGTLRVGTTGDFNPMSIKDTTTNTLTGFDVEAMTQLAADMGVKIEFVPADRKSVV